MLDYPNSRWYIPEGPTDATHAAFRVAGLSQKPCAAQSERSSRRVWFVSNVMFIMCGPFRRSTYETKTGHLGGRCRMRIRMHYDRSSRSNGRKLLRHDRLVPSCASVQ